MRVVTVLLPSIQCWISRSIQLHVANPNTIVLLHTLLILVGVWIEMKRGPQQITSNCVVGFVDRLHRDANRVWRGRSAATRQGHNRM